MRFKGQNDFIKRLALSSDSMSDVSGMSVLLESALVVANTVWARNWVCNIVLGSE